MRCPTADQLTDQVLAVLPRGRAWGPRVRDTASPLWQYWRSFAEVLAYFSDRVCALRLEFWCATMSATRDLWMTEYGLPDPCDPFPDICTKVAAIGGTRCEYYQFIAARAGWSIRCVPIAFDCGDVAGCAETGDSQAGGQIGAAMISIIVNVGASPAYVAAEQGEPYAGEFQSGFSLACAPDISALKCILDRVVHAHIQIFYLTEG